MTPVQIAYLAGIFVAVAGVAFAVIRALAPRATKTRLKQVTAENALPQTKADSPWEEAVVTVTEPLAKLALPMRTLPANSNSVAFVLRTLPLENLPPFW